MIIRELSPDHGMAKGFTLLAVLVVTGLLFILATGILLVTGIERGTARSYVDLQRADLAASAAVEEILAILKLETANDDFLILQSALANPLTTGRVPAPHIFLARGKTDGKKYFYHYVPLFSTLRQPPENTQLANPEIEPLVGTNSNEWIDFSTLPYQDKVRACWIPIHDGNGRPVARFAYSVEDMQGKIDPLCAGNLDGPDLTHGRAVYPFPAPGLNPAVATADDVPLDQIALFAIEPDTCSNRQGTLGKTLIGNRHLLMSPDSLLAAANISPPLTRDGTGRLTGMKARAAEENLVANLQPYLERPVIPCVPGINPDVAGTPRMNLNALLTKSPDDAVDEMAAFIRRALPDFDQRKGGFPDDYVKTLAANAIDYADADSSPTLKGNAYRGLDAYPLLSEIALQVNYAGISNKNDRKIMTFRFKLFAELCNPTNQQVSGNARLSYEVALPMDGIGSGVGGEPFDAPSLLANPVCSTHDLTLINGRYWTRQINLSLAPNQYQCYLFADVIYRMDVGASSDNIPDGTPFSLNESKGASGLSLMWNGDVVERTASILRQAGLIYSSKNGVVSGGFKVGTPDTLTKAALPGHVYDDYPNMYYNMGDPRITHYLRSAQLDENAYPENSSPNRRNIRLDIYNKDVPTKPKVYARMLPSEWPDGGHNAPVGTWSPGTSDKTEMTDPKFDFPYAPQMRLAAPQLISNRGRFYSATELGRVFDPIMHAPAFPDSEETDDFRSKGKMPASRTSWPDVSSNQSSPFYGGGNTLRIGRPEHPAFDQNSKPGLHAAHLLDLFHTGLSRSANPAQREGTLTRIMGHVNLNTATRDTLRAMAAGALVMDPMLARQTSADHDGTMMPPTTPLSLSAPTSTHDADRIADAIIHSRPYGSTAGLALAKESNGSSVFGNRTLYQENTRVEWTDAAAEEVFARVYEAATVRSRNFRVWIVAQAVAPSIKPGTPPAVLAEVRKVYTLFADPGQRAADGSIIPGKCKTSVTSSNDF
ncbi:MAG: hypothetical protein NTV46_07120 [Verrucomicrobia bacterium]|nr:hypothetical protein [Verrucomicrobiota bacterium]